ncbi:MAG TPA: glycosyltransferase, partial [Nitrososphaeraceae archaeon]|nr:glycosyltransferase [Nitrososphaeraceae archaeon]
MVNPESKTLADDSETKKSNKISVVLLTQNPLKPMFQSPHKVMSSMPRELSKEIIVVHYNSTNRTSDFDEALESPKGDVNHPDEKILHVRVEGEFASGVTKGIELSVGRYILVMDADLPYSRDIIPELVTALIANPNFIIVASRFVKDAHVRRIPFVQNAI